MCEQCQPELSTSTNIIPSSRDIVKQKVQKITITDEKQRERYQKNTRNAEAGEPETRAKKQTPSIVRCLLVRMEGFDPPRPAAREHLANNSFQKIYNFAIDRIAGSHYNDSMI